MLVFFFLMVMMAVLVSMSILIILVMVMLVLMSMIFVRMRVSVGRAMSMHVLVAMLMREMNVEFDSFDGSFVSAGNVQMVAVEFQLFQFVLQVMRIHTQIEQRAYEHVTANPAEDIEI
jgi:hypothetical protein